MAKTELAYLGTHRTVRRVLCSHLGNPKVGGAATPSVHSPAQNLMTHSPLKVTALDHVTFSVKNLAESVAFYQTLFGFEIKKVQPEDNSTIIGNDALKLCLYEDPEKVCPGGIAHFGLHVKNFLDIVQTCEFMGVSMPYGIVDWGKSRSVYILDPNGYEIELSEVNGGGL